MIANQEYFIAGVVLLFGLIGFWRGWLREVATLAGLLAIWLVLTSLGGTLIGLLNQQFAKAAIVVNRSLSQLHSFSAASPALPGQLVDPRHPHVFFGVSFVVATIIVFLATSRFVPAPSSFSAQLLGFFVGLANGYLITFLGFRYLALTVSLPLLGWSSISIAGELGKYLTSVLLIGVLGTIGVALLSSRRLVRRDQPRPAPKRSRG